jgi:hypothetical protein
MEPKRKPDRTGKRFNLTLPPEVALQVQRVAEAGGTGGASFIRELLIGATPQLKSMADALEATRAGQVDGLAMISKMLRSTINAGEQTQLDLKTSARAMRRSRK